MKIGIIDYGMGNLHSVKGALDLIGADQFVSGDPAALSAADGLILPGVGAFPDAMENLRRSGLDAFIREAVKTTPLLGICLGMQLLFDSSEEFRLTSGLGLIHGKVIKLSAGERDARYKIPHMGWNDLTIVNPSPLLAGLGGKPYVYFVHSYKAVPSDRADLLAVTGYGEEIAAAVYRGNVFGTQFHPEKSQETGLTVLRSFCGIVNGNERNGDRA